MIRIYCESKHGTKKQLCDECSSLEEYAHTRLEKCNFGEEKPKCKFCPIHCYKKDKREQIQQVMRFSGPRMLLRHPITALQHMFKIKKGVS